MRVKFDFIHMNSGFAPRRTNDGDDDVHNDEGDEAEIVLLVFVVGSICCVPKTIVFPYSSLPIPADTEIHCLPGLRSSLTLQIP